MCEKENEEGWIFAQPPLFSGCLRVQSPFPTHPSAHLWVGKAEKMGGATVKSGWLHSSLLLCSALVALVAVVAVVALVAVVAMVHWLQCSLEAQWLFLSVRPFLLFNKPDTELNTNVQIWNAFLLCVVCMKSLRWRHVHTCKLAMDCCSNQQGMYFSERQRRCKAESSHEKFPLTFPRTRAYMRLRVKEQQDDWGRWSIRLQTLTNYKKKLLSKSNFKRQKKIKSNLDAPHISRCIGLVRTTFKPGFFFSVW